MVIVTETDRVTLVLNHNALAARATIIRPSTRRGRLPAEAR